MKSFFQKQRQEFISLNGDQTWCITALNNGAAQVFDIIVLHKAQHEFIVSLRDLCELVT